jgi:hypothetical protein
MNQNIWGPHLWFSLHTITFNYPLKPTQDDKDNYRNFFNSMKNVIPCSVCKKNYIRHLNEIPIDQHLHNRKSLVYWVIDLHNMVNGETGKKILSYDNVIKKYEDAYGKKIVLDGEIDNIYEEKTDYKSLFFYKNIVYYLFVFFLILLLVNLIYTIRKHKNIK